MAQPGLAAEAAAETGGPPRFFVLTTLPSGTLLAGTCVRGMVRSIDGGRTWAPPDVPPGEGPVNTFAALTGGGVLAATAAPGLHRSDDEGATWRPVGLEGVTAYAVLSADGVLLAGTAGHGVVWSDDDGATWRPVEAGPDGLSVYRLLPTADGDVLAGAEGAGVWRLARDGGGWQATPAGLDDLIVYALVRVGDGDRVLAGTRGGGAFLSEDGGSSWERCEAGLPDPVVHVLTVDADGSVVAGTGDGVARWSDGERAWRPVGTGLASRRIFSLVAHPSAGLLAGSYDGVWALAPGADGWLPVDTGLAGDAFSVSVDAGGAVFAGTAAGLLGSLDAGATWTEVGHGIDGVTTHAVVRLAPGGLLAATDGGVFQADDGGGPWSPAGLTGERVRCLLEVEPGRVLAGTLGSGLFCHSGPGEPWEPVDTGLGHAMAFDLLRTSHGAIVLVTGDAAGAAKTGAVLCSHDGGRTWGRAAVDPVTCYRVVEDSSGALFVGAQRSRILRSRDGGERWDVLETTGLTEAKLYALAVDGDDRLFLGTGKGLLRSDDEAETWERLDEGLDGVTVYDVRAHPSGTLVAATSAGPMRSFDGGDSWR